MNFLSKAKAYLLSAFAMFQTSPAAFTPERFKASLVTSHAEAPATARNTPQARLRKSVGIPRGVPGAKLARKALRGSIGKAVLK